MKLVSLLKCKLHGVTVTDANLEYQGSISIDESLMDRVGLLPGELVHVWNVSNGERFQTYAIPAPAQSRMICINGAAARLCQRTDKLIVAAFVLTDEMVTPRVALVNERNEFVAYA